LSYNDIHVINQNFYYHQNFKEQIEDEFNRTLNEFEHIEPFNRPLLPKQQSSKKFFAMIEILNQFILPRFVNNTSFKKLHSIIQGVPELADQTYRAFSLVIIESNSV
jgi:uncharacterized protein YllA (UPF0747 family)